MKKLTTTKLGKIWTGVTVDHPGMLAAARAFIAQTRWNGPFELECMVEGDRIHLIEINPRFPAWVAAAAGVGINLPARLARSALGLPLGPIAPPAAGRLFVRYTSDLIADMSIFQSLVTTGVTP